MIVKKVLNNGLRLVLEHLPYVKSVSIGIWIGTGSRNETYQNNGVSHFIEHMAFKGTKTRTAKEIAESIDDIGGQLNAFTGKECTCFYAKTLDTHIETAVEVLADMMFNSKFAERDMNLEKKVVLEEIGMYEDTLEDLVHDLLSSITWKENALSFPILGTAESVQGIDRKTIMKYLNDNYVAQNTVISVAGNFDTENIINMLEKYFGGWEAGESRMNFDKAEFSPTIRVKEKESEQVHICMGMNAIEHGDERLYSALVINNVFGGGMSSRLFQSIREKKGLAYSIYSFPTSYKRAGVFSIYAGMNSSNVKEVLKLTLNEIDKLCKKGLSDEEIKKSKEQLKGNYILGLESTSSRMNSIGKSELVLGEILTPEEILAKIDKVDKDMVREVINMVFKTKDISLAAVGNVNKDIDFAGMLK